jgi:hypothetical protein
VAIWVDWRAPDTLRTEAAIAALRAGAGMIRIRGQFLLRHRDACEREVDQLLKGVWSSCHYVEAVRIESSWSDLKAALRKAGLVPGVLPPPPSSDGQVPACSGAVPESAPVEPGTQSGTDLDAAANVDPLPHPVTSAVASSASPSQSVATSVSDAAVKRKDAEYGLLCFLYFGLGLRADGDVHIGGGLVVPIMVVGQARRMAVWVDWRAPDSSRMEAAIAALRAGAGMIRIRGSFLLDARLECVREVARVLSADDWSSCYYVEASPSATSWIGLKDALRGAGLVSAVRETTSA